MTNGPEQRQHVIVGYMHDDMPLTEKHSRMSEILGDQLRKHSSALGGVVIAVPVTNDAYPYGALAYASRDMV